MNFFSSRVFGEGAVRTVGEMLNLLICVKIFWRRTLNVPSALLELNKKISTKKTVEEEHAIQKQFVYTRFYSRNIYSK